MDTDHRVMVGRSRELTGPYVDREGVPLPMGGGTQVVAGYRRYAGPGGSDVYRDDDGTDLIVHHYYDRDDGGRAKLSVRSLECPDGWPGASEPFSDSRPSGYRTVRWNADGPASWRAYADPELGVTAGG